MFPSRRLLGKVIARGCKHSAYDLSLKYSIGLKTGLSSINTSNVLSQTSIGGSGCFSVFLSSVRARSVDIMTVIKAMISLHSSMSPRSLFLHCTHRDIQSGIHTTSKHSIFLCSSSDTPLSSFFFFSHSIFSPVKHQSTHLLTVWTSCQSPVPRVSLPR